MAFNTASEVISFARKLEEDSAQLYKDIAQRYKQCENVFISFAEENHKNIAEIERAYYGVISDAIEGCFAFSLEADKYVFKAKLDESVSYSEILRGLLTMEERIIKFYYDAAEQSHSLLADVPRVLTKIAEKREGRKAKLTSAQATS